MSPLILMKVGADPEALFWSRKEKAVIPASSFCGGRGAFNSWIGTDGHQRTAEFRPIPSRNVLMVLANLATAIGEVEKVLVEINQRNSVDLALVAQPAFQGENLGGHIHVSFWYPYPEFAIGPGPNYENIYLHLFRFMSPFLQWPDRGNYTYRAQPKPATNRSVKVGYRAARIEFRQPPTWLASPVLAYTFLGLAKMAILNYPNLPVNNFPNLSAGSYVDFLREMKVTSDLRTLVSTVEYVLAHPLTNNPDKPCLVDFEAWRGVLV